MFNKIMSAEWRIEYCGSHSFSYSRKKCGTYLINYNFSFFLNIAQSLAETILEIIPLDFIIKHVRDSYKINGTISSIYQYLRNPCIWKYFPWMCERKSTLLWSISVIRESIQYLNKYTCKRINVKIDISSPFGITRELSIDRSKILMKVKVNAIRSRYCSLKWIKIRYLYCTFAKCDRLMSCEIFNITVICNKNCPFSIIYRCYLCHFSV